jgi:hypothetical protein
MEDLEFLCSDLLLLFLTRSFNFSIVHRQQDLELGFIQLAVCVVGGRASF